MDWLAERTQRLVRTEWKLSGSVGGGGGRSVPALAQGGRSLSPRCRRGALLCRFWVPLCKGALWQYVRSTEYSYLFVLAFMKSEAPPLFRFVAQQESKHRPAACLVSIARSLLCVVIYLRPDMA